MTRCLRRGRRIGYLGCRRVDHARREVKVGRVHRGQGNVRRVNRHHNGLIWRGRLWVLPAVIRTIYGGDWTFTLYRGVAHLELCRSLCSNGTCGKDLRIRKPRVEAHWAAMDNSRGGGKAIDIKGPKPLGAHA
eukprot:scaffold12304_cov121-Isochrysis_galbana.AAC.5